MNTQSNVFGYPKVVCSLFCVVSSKTLKYLTFLLTVNLLTLNVVIKDTLFEQLVGKRSLEHLLSI